MTVNEMMSELKSLGSEQTCKTYKRHGVRGDMFGVSYANLGKIKKKIKVDHKLAEQLWATGNHDARIVATMIADPKQVTDKTVESWAKDLDSYAISDAFSKLIGATTLARKKAEKWTKAKQEWIGAAGWQLMSFIAMNDKELADDYFDDYLSLIESNIHDSKNRVRYAMNGALIAIGLRSPGLEKKALAAAKKIGVVTVDHGETGCKTPDAAEYIQKVKGRRKAASGA
ncbi:MAG TPA: DNA alkylation repair protein [Blastocatellia bacterium]|nr:DNA alkylation repair protein [Blastocatellia bacterium]